MTVDALLGLASRIQVLPNGPTAPSPGQPTGGRIVLPAEGLHLDTIAEGPIDLSWVTKDVRFRNVLPDVPASGATEQAERIRQVLAALFGAMPIGSTGLDELSDLPLPGTTPTTQAPTAETADIADPGVPGVLGRLAGVVPVPMKLPVRVEAVWAVTSSPTPPTRDGNGLPSGPDVLANGTDFHSPGLAGTDVSVVLRPAMAELASGVAAPTATRYLHAGVRLSVSDTLKTPWIGLPPITLTVPALLVPTVLVLFTNKSFAATEGTTVGYAVIVVPANSPLRDAGGVLRTLGEVAAAARNLATVPGFAGMLVNVQPLLSALDAYEDDRVKFQPADAIENLEHIHLDPGGVGTVGRLTAEDSVDSVVLVGPEWRFVDLYVRRKHEKHDPNNTDEGGLLRLTAGRTLCAMVPDLDSAEPASVPASAPDDALTGEPGTKVPVAVRHPPHEWGRRTFHDLFSSLHFGGWQR